MNPQQPTDNPTPSPGVVVGQGVPETPGTAPSSSPQVSGGRKKPMLGLIVIGVVVVVAVVVFFVYQLIANNPNKLWSTAVTNTNQLSTNLVSYYGQPNSNGYDYTGNLSSNDGSGQQSGTVTGSTGSQGQTQTLKFGVVGDMIAIDTVNKNVSGSAAPDIYYRLTGVKALSGIFQGNSQADTFISNATQIDGQWLTQNHTDLNNGQANVPLTQANHLPLPNASYQAEVSKINALNQQYLYSNNGASAILTNRQNIGAETSNKRAVYHYKFTFQATHYQQYVVALVSALGQQSLGNNPVLNSLGVSTIFNGLTTAKQSETVDVWVDKATKTISKVHIPVAGGGNNYVEIGFKYVNATTSPFYATLSGADNNVTSMQSYSLGLNSSNKSLVYSYNLSNSDGTTNTTSSGSETISPRQTVLNVSAPSGAVNYSSSYVTALNGVLGSIFGTSSSQ